jgi:hypothetical protein
MKRKPKPSRIAQEAAAELHRMRHISTLERVRAYLEGREPAPDLPGYDPNYKGMSGPGDTSSDFFSYLEEQNVIDHAVAKKVRQGLRRGGNKGQMTSQSGRRLSAVMQPQESRFRPSLRKSENSMASSAPHQSRHTTAGRG